MKPRHSLLGLILATTLAGGCQQAEDPATSAGPSQPQAPRKAGTITIDGRTWEVIADVQCSVLPGPVVAIAGHAADDEAVEIVIDYNGNQEPTGASVKKPDGTVDWTAYASMNFQIERQRVQGSGYFTGMSGGAQTQAAGQFDVDCRR